MENTPVGGYYVFHDGPGFGPLVILARPDLNRDLMKRVDEILDDGNLFSGVIRGDNQSLDYTLE